MHFSDDDLAAALRRKDPGPDFTQRVMTAIGDQKHSIAPQTQRWWLFRFSPVLAGAIAAVVLVIAAAWLGLTRYQQQREMAHAEKARQEAILALRITNAKLNHVFRRVSQDAPQPKIRRQSL